MTPSSVTHALSVNPATGETLAARPWATAEEVNNAVALADRGYRQWRELDVEQRAGMLRRVGATLRLHGETMAQRIRQEMGKPIVQARGEVKKSADLCDWYAEHGPAMLRTEP
ncbi:aldehyde dehydrogenase family protein, partial [Enterobacter sp.]|uniref:aldehyde dehydrogenase family protein n=1 Tax=Enterobacter sp. TaxID=42895 RepID=UPI00296E41BE